MGPNGKMNIRCLCSFHLGLDQLTSTYIQKLIQELINFESPKATITQRPHMKQPQTSLKEKPSWSLFRGVKVKLAWSKKLSTNICKKYMYVH